MASPGPVEKATRAELRLLHLSVRTSAAAAAAVVVAKRLDATTGAASAAAAARELRLAMAALACGQGGELAMDPEIQAMFEAFR
jgi:hypothetical protein